MTWLRDLFESFGWIGPRRRLRSSSVSEPETAIERYQPQDEVTYDPGGSYMTREEVREELQFRDDMAEIRLRTVKRAADAKRVADAAVLESEKAKTDIARQKNDHDEVVAHGELRKELRPIERDTAIARARAERDRAEGDAAGAAEQRTAALTDAEIKSEAHKKRFIESVGPSEEQLAELKTQDERRQELEEWAFGIALNAARWAGKTLAEEPPYTEHDGYYALAGVHYYAGRLADLSDGDALVSATRAVLDQIKRHGPLSQDEAKANAIKAKNTRKAWFRKQAEEAEAARKAQSESAAVEVARNQAKAEELGLARVEKLENVIQGRRDGEHFDSKA